MSHQVHSCSNRAAIHSRTASHQQAIGSPEPEGDRTSGGQSEIVWFRGIKELFDLRILSAVMGAAVLLLLPSCAPTVDTDAIAKELTRLDDDWSAAAAAKDIDKVASYYAADANVYPNNSPLAVGRDAARKLWAEGLADSTYTISWKTVHAGASRSGDIGFTAGTYEDSFKEPGGTMVNEKGKYLCVWAKQADGTWKAIHDIWNTDSK